MYVNFSGTIINIRIEEDSFTSGWVEQWTKFKSQSWYRVAQNETKAQHCKTDFEEYCSI